MKALKWLDETWLRLEKAGVVVGFLVMSFVVFADASFRIAADPSMHTPRTLATVAFCLWLLTWAGLRTAQKGSRGTGAEAALALLGPVAIMGGLWLFVTLAPNGVVWAQKLALVLTLWVSFLGASIATAENKHLKVDAADRLFRGRTRLLLAGVGSLIASAACLALAVLAVAYCREKYELYVETEGAAGEFEGLPVPQYLAFGIMPVALGVMGVRFLAAAVQRFLGVEPKVESFTQATEEAPS